MIQVRDGKKAVSFDGFVLEVFGISGAGKSQRYTADQIEKIGVTDGKGEVLLVARLPRGGGFGMAFSMAKRGELEQLVAEVEKARSQAEGSS
jgi:hypothetical protein